jgi:hypothetical protein
MCAGPRDYAAGMVALADLVMDPAMICSEILP